MYHTIVCTQFSKMLGNLAAILNQGATYARDKNVEVEVLLNARLALDQFNLIRQVQIACDTAKLGAARLIGKEKEAPSHPDTERTLDELQARIQSTISYLNSLAAHDFNESSARRITQSRWQGKSLSGTEYFEQHIVPNFYFHVTTAYAILRHHGVNVGKKDYLGPLPMQG